MTARKVTDEPGNVTYENVQRIPEGGRTFIGGTDAGGTDHPAEGETTALNIR